MPSEPELECRLCRYSEGEAVALPDGTALILWCLLNGRVADGWCEHFKPMEDSDV